MWGSGSVPAWGTLTSTEVRAAGAGRLTIGNGRSTARDSTACISIDGAPAPRRHSGRGGRLVRRRHRVRAIVLLEKRRNVMSMLGKLAVAPACVGFILATVAPSSAAPDYWVGMGGSAVDTTHAPADTPAGKLYVAKVMLGNGGSPGQYGVQVYLRVKLGDTLVCGASTTIAPPPTAGHAVEALEFDLVVPHAAGAITLPRGVSKGTAAAQLVQYTLEAELSQSGTLPAGVYEEGNTSNN